MNIKRAKQEIANTVRAYLCRNEDGEYAIPAIRQRPILLMGPPGIGKTQIMEQVAREQGVALVAYTITHHTRQSAVGLPMIQQRQYGGKTVSVTEYTMSEIIASVYQRMEDTGLSQGILFIDEINCVSETLAPTMLQFLQCKTFGNQKMPEGWVIAAAGNPPEYNKSVREFDIVTLDRVKRMDVEADLPVWKEYARANGVHPAILSYLELRPDHFYKVMADVDGTQFVTARGWEDLSTLIRTYEQLGLEVDEPVVRQYLQHENIARDFAAYLALYKKYQDDYGVEAILAGQAAPSVFARAFDAAFDERLSLVSLLLSGLNTRFEAAQFQDSLTDEVYQELKRLRPTLVNGQEAPASLLRAQIAARQARFDQKKKADLATAADSKLHKQAQARLEEYAALLADEPFLTGEDAFGLVQEAFTRQVEQREAAAAEAGRALEAAFDFMEKAFGPGQEMVVFITELSLGPASGPFIAENGCERYDQYSQNLLLDSRRADLARRLANQAAQDAEAGLV